MQVIGNAGYKLSWAADPTPAPYWMSRALEHGFLRCTANGTTFSCEVELPPHVLMQLPALPGVLPYAAYGQGGT